MRPFEVMDRTAMRYGRRIDTQTRAEITRSFHDRLQLSKLGVATEHVTQERACRV